MATLITGAGLVGSSFAQEPASGHFSGEKFSRLAAALYDGKRPGGLHPGSKSFVDIVLGACSGYLGNRLVTSQDSAASGKANSRT